MARSNALTLDRAKRLRRDMTAAEARLWGYLRGRRLQGHKFVRQVPVGPYIIDFLCREARLVIEVDGATHSSDAEIEHDVRRTAFLEREGFQVLRLNNSYVMGSLDDALGMIVAALEKREG